MRSSHTWIRFHFVATARNPHQCCQHIRVCLREESSTDSSPPDSIPDNPREGPSVNLSNVLGQIEPDPANCRLHPLATSPAFARGGHTSVGCGRDNRERWYRPPLRTGRPPKIV